MTWTDDDFRTIFGFLADINCALAPENKDVLDKCRDLLRTECQEATRRLSRISDAVCACR